MERQEADELVVLAALVALALARGKNADEVAVLGGFVVVVGDALALISVVLACQENAAEDKEKTKKLDELAAKLAELEQQVKALQA